MNKTIAFWVALLFLFCGSVFIYVAWKYGWRVESGGSAGANARPAGLNQEPILKAFTLTDRTGKPLHSRELEGQVRVASFFFSVCPTVCPKQNAKIAELVKEFGPQGVKFLSLTCDPDTDTPVVLAEYAKRFDAPEKQWYFLTGEQNYLRRVGAEIYQVPVDKQVHSEKLIVQDRWGNIRGRYHWDNAADMAELKRKLSQLLAETSPPAEEPVKQTKPVDLDDDGLIDSPPGRS